jgi:hypothetical protein
MIDGRRERRNTWVNTETEGERDEPPIQLSSTVLATVLAGERRWLPTMTR